MAVNLNDWRNATQRGWGPMWPNCDTSRWVALEVLSLRGGRKVRFPAHRVDDAGQFSEEVGFPGGIRTELRELAELLLRESEIRAYINLEPGWCWGAACRPIKKPGGGLTTTPSNHSAATAIDINAPTNGFGASTHTIPVQMGRLWNRYGWRWGGDYAGTKDWMHFEFMGTPEDARRMLARARADGIGRTEQEVEDQMFEEWHSGWEAHEVGERIRKRWSRAKKDGWTDRNRLLRDAVTKATAAVMEETETDEP